MKGRWVVSLILVSAAAAFAAALPSVVALAQTPISGRNYVPGGGDFPFAHPAFRTLWKRIDLVYTNQKVARTWFWGPMPDSVPLYEPYLSNTTLSGQRLVQYFDKNRMEINNPNADAGNAFGFVTNGLLSVELISGQMQVGTDSYITGNNACISMTGDAIDDALAPTYFAFQGVSNTFRGAHNAVARIGQKPIQTIDHNGNVGRDDAKTSIANIDFVQYVNNHNIPRVFWDFLHTSGPVYLENDQLANQQLVNPWYYAAGLPISEPYWARATIGGKITNVMIQAFERGILTYTPSNTPGWQVEMGNIGQHYFNWRYVHGFGLCPGATAVTEQKLVVAPLVTPIVVSHTPTSTPGTPGSRTATRTSTPGARTATRTSTPPRTGTGTVVIPPSPTRTNTPTIVRTAVPPTATNQPPALTTTPTTTSIPTSTETSVPPPTDTFTPIRLPNTNTPTKTKTPKP